MLESFNGKVCVITGGASGLGLALAKKLAAAKASVIIADIDKAAAESAAIELMNQSLLAKAVEADVSNPSSVQSLIEKVVQDFNKIDYFFNNAGTAIIGEIRDFSLSQWQHIVNLNLMGTIHGMHFVYPQMLAQKSGHIVNIASGFGLAPGPTNGPYVTTKFAIVGLSEVLRAEAKDLGIDVTVVCPGFIDTKLVQTAQVLKANPEEFQAQIPVSILPAELAADIIVKGLIKKKNRIVFPAYVRFLAALYTRWPRLYFQFNLTVIRKFRLIRKDNG